MSGAIRHLTNRMRNVFASGKTTGPVTVVQNIPQVQVQLSALEVQTLQIVEQSGHHSNLPVGTPILAAFVGGDRSNGVVIGSMSPATRPAMAGPQDAALQGYGFYVLVTSTGIQIVGNTTIMGNLAVTGNISATGSIIAGAGGADQVNLQTHKHPATNTSPTPGT